MNIFKKSALLFLLLSFSLPLSVCALAKEESGGIKWVEFGVTKEALADTAAVDIKTYGQKRHYSWIELLSFLGQKYGGDFSRYKKSDLTKLLKEAEEKEISELAKNKKLYNYYLSAYGATLSGLLGPYKKEWEKGGITVWEEGYGIRAFSPIAALYSYNHYDDFGASRSYGYKRKHLGHDMMGSVGTPIVATEGGIIEHLGWNQYGGWRIGIRSYDGKRYYYYAHLRKNHPYADLYEGQCVAAGEVIGYLGMTGYSAKENVNNINVPHLHYGIQLIFSPEQKDGINQIWLDCYALTEFLSAYRSRTYFCEESGERKATFRILVPETPE